MVRRHRGRQVHGWLNIDKPAGMTSAACVGVAKRHIGAAKLGHAGTLDPMASGVLPLALGEATKTVRWLVDADKCYRLTIRWGERRDSDDATGSLVESSPVRPARDAIKAVLPSFTGEVLQTPPAYSAIKVRGRRAYAMARAGDPVDLPARLVRIDRIELVDIPDEDHAELAVTCGKGTYMRSLARDLGDALGTHGHIAALRRTRVGRFAENASISLEKLGELGHSAAAGDALLPITTALADIPVLAVSASEAARLRNGQAVPVLRPADRAQLQALGDDAIVLATDAATPVALARVDGIQVRPVRVLNL